MKKMYRMDYHLHSNHSMDAEMPMRALCRAAVAVGLDEICLTEHTEFGHPAPGSDAPPAMPEWIAEIKAMRETFPMLVIRAGIEIGDNPRCRERIKAWHDQQPLDFRLLSLHLIDQADPYFPDFYVGKQQAHCYRQYVEAKLESLSAWDPTAYDAMAHLGYCAKYAPYPMAERPLRYHHAPDAFDEIFRILAENGKALEINTSGRRAVGEDIPGPSLLERYAALGGEFVTIGSDAHETRHVGYALDEARAVARSAGLRYALTFSERKPIPILL